MLDMVDKDILFAVVGLCRSGTIWATRLFAGSLLLTSQTRYNDPPFVYEDDPAVWYSERQGKVIRRLHDTVDTYPYQNIPCIVIMRDPRDMAISMTEIGWDCRTLANYAKKALDLLPEWCDYYQEWELDSRRVYTVRYKDLLENAQMEIVTAIDALNREAHLNLTAEPKIIQAVIKENTFVMMENWKKGNYGKDGAWHDKLPQSIADSIWQQYGQCLAQFGYNERGVGIKP